MFCFREWLASLIMNRRRLDINNLWKYIRINTWHDVARCFRFFSFFLSYFIIYVSPPLPCSWNYVHISGTLKRDKVWCNIFWFLRTEQSDNRYLLQICPVSEGPRVGTNRPTRRFINPPFNFSSFRNSRR